MPRLIGGALEVKRKSFDDWLINPILLAFSKLLEMVIPDTVEADIMRAVLIL